jgi:hypothetical protein
MLSASWSSIFRKLLLPAAAVAAGPSLTGRCFKSVCKTLDVFLVRGHCTEIHSKPASPRWYQKCSFLVAHDAAQTFTKAMCLKVLEQLA